MAGWSNLYQARPGGGMASRGAGMMAAGPQAGDPFYNHPGDFAFGPALGQPGRDLNPMAASRTCSAASARRRRPAVAAWARASAWAAAAVAT